MSLSNPIVSVYNCVDGRRRDDDGLAMPAVFNSPIRADLISFVVSQLGMNKRQAYGVYQRAGYGTAAESWGTGRAVARIPRVPGGGTHRAGQGAFGNMCRGGGMFNPTPIWRRWHRRLNIRMRRYAIASALAASTSTPLVLARGHKIQRVPELPLVVDNDMEKMDKTKDAIKCLTALGLGAELNKVTSSRKIRSGIGKSRNRKYVMRKGPIIIYLKDSGITKAFRNIPGVTLCQVQRLNILRLAPGGHLGRMIIWTQAAFEKLKDIYGKDIISGTNKKNFTLPANTLSNADLGRIINSDAVQSLLRPQINKSAKRIIPYNPLKNKIALEKISPGAQKRKENRIRKQTPGTKEHQNIVQARKIHKINIVKQKLHKVGTALYKKTLKDFTDTAKEALAKLQAEKNRK